MALRSTIVRPRAGLERAHADVQRRPPRLDAQRVPVVIKPFTLDEFQRTLELAESALALEASAILTTPARQV